MNVARIALLGVAVLAAGGAAFLARSLTSKTPKARTVAAIEAASAQVLVAAHAIEPGTVLTAADLRWQKWPQDGTNESYLTQKAAPKAIEDAVGAIVRSHVEPGEPLTRAKFVKAKDAGFMAAMLAPGYRAVSIKISEESAAGGFILPGDQVDVIAVRKVEDSSSGGGSGTQFAAQTELENVRVLAIGQTFEQSGGDKTIVAKTATLELSEAQAELISAAQASGDLSLSLRSVVTGDLTAAIHSPPARPGGDMVRIVRYGHMTRALPALSRGGAH